MFSLIGQNTANGTQYTDITFLRDATGTVYGLQQGSNLYYFAFNVQGDVIGIYAADGTVIATYDYDDWGVCTVNILAADSAGNAITSANHIANINPIRYRGYYYDAETNFYFLQTRYYDPVVRRFINADSYISTGQDVLGTNMYAYCGNNPVNRADPTGMFWKEIGDWLKDKWTRVKNWAGKTFGAGVVQSQTYETVSADTIIYGNEAGFSTSKVIYGDISKPVSVYAKNASKKGNIWEYKVGIQVNANKGGFNYETSGMESILTLSDGDTSLELIFGANKIGYTINNNVNFGKRTASTYYHEYVRTIPTGLAVCAVYYTLGAALAMLPTVAYSY